MQSKFARSSIDPSALLKSCGCTGEKSSAAAIPLIPLKFNKRRQPCAQPAEQFQLGDRNRGGVDGWAGPLPPPRLAGCDAWPDKAATRDAP